jgi:hypothetical protein
MKRVTLLLALFTSLCGASRPTPVDPLPMPPESVEPQKITPEIVLSNAIQSIGGRREIEAIDSFQLHGLMHLTNNRPVIEIELATSKGGKVLGVVSFGDLGKTSFGSDGTTAWEQSFEPDQSPIFKIIDQETLSQKVEQINWLEWFTMLPKKLETMSFDGITQFDGEDCYKLKIQDDASKPEIAFFSVTTHRPKGRRTIESTPNGDTVVDVYFRDWKHVDKLLLFHTVIFSRDEKQVRINIDLIEVDSVDESIFELPQQVKKLRDQP